MQVDTKVSAKHVVGQHADSNMNPSCITENPQHCAVLRRHAWPFRRGTAKSKLNFQQCTLTWFATRHNAVVYKMINFNQVSGALHLTLQISVSNYRPSITLSSSSNICGTLFWPQTGKLIKTTLKIDSIFSNSLTLTQCHHYSNNNSIKTDQILNCMHSFAKSFNW